MEVEGLRHAVYSGGSSRARVIGLFIRVSTQAKFLLDVLVDHGAVHLATNPSGGEDQGGLDTSKRRKASGQGREDNCNRGKKVRS